MSGSWIRNAWAVAMICPLWVLGARPLQGVEPNSVRVRAQGATAVELLWEDLSPTEYCIERESGFPIVTVIDRTGGLTYTDSPPGSAPLWFYQIEEEGSALCPVLQQQCTPAGSLACGQPPVNGNNGQAGSTDAVDDYPACGLLGATGPEYVYELILTQDDTVTVTLTNMSADLDLAVLLDQGNGCDPATCIATGDTQVVFNGTAGTTYFIAVDGMADAIGDYTLSLDCQAGQTPACDPVETVICDVPYSGRNDGPGSTTAVSAYPGCALTGLTGPEYTYDLLTNEDLFVMATLSNVTANLHIIAIEDRGNGCDPDDCVADGDVSATFLARAGIPYYVVVDGMNGATGSFDLDLTCWEGSVPCEPAATAICDIPVFGRNDDPGSNYAMDEYPPCSPWDESGPDYVYSFMPGGSGPVSVDLTGPQDIDLFVLTDPFGLGECDPENCVTSGDASAVFDAVAGEQYYIAIDGRNGATGAYALDIACSFLPGQCAPARTLGCDEQVFKSNNSPGSTDANDAYGCAGSPGDMTGPEYTFAFTPGGGSQDYRVRARLFNLTAELDLFVLEDRGTGCDPNNCVAWGETEVSFDALAGTQYYLAVDGRNSATGSFTIRTYCTALSDPCQPNTSLVCGDTLTGQSNAQPGSTDNIDEYQTCKILRPLDETGPEYTYGFVPSSNRTATLTLSNIAGGTPHVYLIQDQGDGCNADDCIAFSTDGTLQFDATAGTQYYIVVDGFLGSVADYDISLSCN